MKQIIDRIHGNLKGPGAMATIFLSMSQSH